MHDCFVAPDEFRTVVNHSAKEIHVRAGAAHFNPERRHIRRQNAAKEQHISGPGLRPVQKKAGRVRRPLEKSSFDRPGWRFKIERRPYRPKYAIYVVSYKRLEQLEKPVVLRIFVIINERDKLAASVR